MWGDDEPMPMDLTKKPRKKRGKLAQKRITEKTKITRARKEELRRILGSEELREKMVYGEEVKRAVFPSEECDVFARTGRKVLDEITRDAYETRQSSVSLVCKKAEEFELVPMCFGAACSDVHNKPPPSCTHPRYAVVYSRPPSQVETELSFMDVAYAKERDIPHACTLQYNDMGKSLRAITCAVDVTFDRSEVVAENERMKSRPLQSREEFQYIKDRLETEYGIKFCKREL